MNTTRDMIRKAGMRMNREPVHKNDQTIGFLPLCPLPAVSEKQEEAGELASEQAVNCPTRRVVVSQPIRENSVYRQLMRSHDRMNTRHLKG